MFYWDNRLVVVEEFVMFKRRLVLLSWSYLESVFFELVYRNYCLLEVRVDEFGSVWIFFRCCWFWKYEGIIESSWVLVLIKVIRGYW